MRRWSWRRLHRLLAGGSPLPAVAARFDEGERLAAPGPLAAPASCLALGGSLPLAVVRWPARPAGGGDHAAP